MSWLTLWWLVIQFVDLAYRGVFEMAFTFDRYSIVFLLQTILLLIPAQALQIESVRSKPGNLLRLTLVLIIGGLLYRFTPTSIAFIPLGNYTYFPSAIEILMSVGFTALAVVIFLFAVKRFAILPASQGKIAAEAAIRPFDTL